mmetsp:Transcript_11821/g.35657  ORF Transcript_11821/g.35657 Transcript_11821/m.35657 type:complete len:268 (-) Transcript_11821:523-1326(-)
MPGAPSRNFFAAFSQLNLALSFTTFVSAFTSLSLRPKASDRVRSSVVLSTAANSGCQTCTKSTGTAASASKDASLQKSKPMGSPAFRATGSSAPATVRRTPSFTATRMPRLAFVEQTSMACFLPAFATRSLASPKPFDWTSAIFCSAPQVFVRVLQPEPSLERFSSVAAFSSEAASSSRAFTASLPSSWATARRSAAMMGSAYRARTYMSVPPDFLPLLTSRRDRLAFWALSTVAMRTSRAFRELSRTSSQAKSCLSIGNCFWICGR